MSDAATAWVLIHPAEDVPGQWVAHVLDYDQITMGNSPSHALAMAEEAVALLLEERQSPRRAEDAAYERLFSIVREGDRVDSLGTVANVEAIAAVIRVRAPSAADAPLQWVRHAA